MAENRNNQARMGRIPEGSWVRLLQIRLLEKALAPWPRRDSPLLEINCGDGPFLRFFWQCGFAIAATEEEAEKRGKAMERNVPHLDLRAATDNDLPFEDESLDWVVLHIRHSEPERVEAALLEALRVGKRGIMITFWNRSSLSGLWKRLHRKGVALPECALAPDTVISRLRAFGCGALKIHSTLLLPEFTWKKGNLLGALNFCLSDSPFGAWCIVRAVPGRGTLVTPMPLRLQGQLRHADSPLEYQKNRSLNDTK